MDYVDYDGKYLKIRKAIHEAGFDEFCQAGGVNRFHKMNIVAECAALGRRFWFCVTGGYNVKDELYIASRDLNTGKEDERVYCRTQEEMADKIKDIRDQITAAKAKNGKLYTHDEAMLIVEMFEDVLCTNGIKVPSPEDDEREPGNEAALYGSTYSDLLDSVEAALIALLDKHSPGAEVVKDRFSGTV